MTNELIDMMREYRIDDTHVFGTLDDPDPAGPRIGPMLEEIHRLRTAHPALDVGDEATMRDRGEWFDQGYREGRRLASSAAVDVPAARIDWQGVLANALCASDDWEKAEQGFGPLDSGWTNPGSDHIAWWINAYGVPAIAAAIADAVSKEGE